MDCQQLSFSTTSCRAWRFNALGFEQLCPHILDWFYEVRYSHTRMFNPDFDLLALSLRHTHPAVFRPSVLQSSVTRHLVILTPSSFCLSSPVCPCIPCLSSRHLTNLAHHLSSITRTTNRLQYLLPLRWPSKQLCSQNARVRTSMCKRLSPRGTAPIINPRVATQNCLSTMIIRSTPPSTALTNCPNSSSPLQLSPASSCTLTSAPQ